MRYLFAAETDKNQDFIFRSSRLQQVAGGSLLLSRFCREGVPALLARKEFGSENKEWGILVNDGGSFRIWFTTQEKAALFAGMLPELYHQASGASLTTAKELPQYDPEDVPQFAAANKEASAALQAAKHSGQGRRSVTHLPHMALCSACGVEPGCAYAELKQDEKVYLCFSCQKKLAEWRSFSGKQQPGQTRTDFLTSIRASAWKLHEPLAGSDPFFPKEPAEMLAIFDPNRYVAYLLADGNGMGQLFGKCTGETQLTALSAGLPEAMRCAFTEPLLALEIACKKVKGGDLSWIPLSPLILGGDDLFAILPAPWALDFTRRVCLAFEQHMSTELTLAGILPDGDMQPTLSAALVICKANYPYRLAHKLGEALLKDAKRLSRSGRGNATRSVVNFQVVQGSDIPIMISLEQDQMHSATLRPYWAGDNSNDCALPIDRLLDLRADPGLNNVSTNRIRAVAERFSPSSLQEKAAEWEQATSQLVERTRRFNPNDAEALTRMLTELGCAEPGATGSQLYWKSIERNNIPHNASGVLDLMEVWNFANKLPHTQNAAPEPDKGENS